MTRNWWMSHSQLGLALDSKCQQLIPGYQHWGSSSCLSYCYSVYRTPAVCYYYFSFLSTQSRDCTPMNIFPRYNGVPACGGRRCHMCVRQATQIRGSFHKSKKGKPEVEVYTQCQRLNTCTLTEDLLKMDRTE